MKKNHLAIIRFGNSRPVVADLLALKSIEEELSDHSIACNLMVSGVLFMINTDSSIDEVIDAFKLAENKTGDTLPILIWDISKNDAPKFHVKDLSNVTELLNEYRQKFMGENPGSKIASDLTIDELLDKIREGGLESLSDAEHARLKSLTK